VSLAAICSARMHRAEEAAAKFGAAQAFDDYEKMLREVDPDIVYVGGPVGLHREMVLSAAEAGKHVICEKPLAVDAVEGAAMLRAMEQKKLAHLVTFTMRGFAGPHTVKTLLDAGTVGEVRHINIAFWFSLPPSAPRVYGWLNDLSKGGGMLNAMGSHYIDLVRHFAGDFARVSGETRTWRTELPDERGRLHQVTADDSFLLTGTLTGGAAVSIHMSSEVTVGSGARLEIYGSEGSIVLDGADKLRVAKRGDSALHEVALEEPRFDPDAAQCKVPRFGQLISDLVHWIESEKPASPSMYDALRVQQVIDALRRSGREGRAMQVPEAFE
jgi:predicted dehydrogenase